MDEDEDLIGKSWWSAIGTQWRVISRYSAGRFTVQVRSGQRSATTTLSASAIRQNLATAKRLSDAAAKHIALTGSTAPTWQQMVQDDYETLNGGSP